MGDRLEPRGARPFTAADIERMLRAEFRHVFIDIDEGTRFVREHADRIDGYPDSFFNHSIAAIAARRRGLKERAKELRALPHGVAAAFTFGDAEGLTQHFIFVPGEAIMFGYRGAEDEARRRPLVDRCARTLDCDVVLF